MDIKISWVDDCQGKKDYDADLVQLSSRYWPRGGGFTAFIGGRVEENDARPEIKPSASSSIMLGDETLVSEEFEGADEAEVMAKVEQWAAQQIARVEAAVRAAFAAERSVNRPLAGQTKRKHDGLSEQSVRRTIQKNWRVDGEGPINP